MLQPGSVSTVWAVGGLWLFQVGACVLFVVSMYCVSPLAISSQPCVCVSVSVSHTHRHRHIMTREICVFLSSVPLYKSLHY